MVLGVALRRIVLCPLATMLESALVLPIAFAFAD